MVLTATALVNGECQNSTPVEWKPLNRLLKNLSQVGDMTPYAKFCTNLSTGGFSANGKWVHLIMLASLSSLCQKLSELVKIWQSYNKNNFACFFSETRCICTKFETDDENWVPAQDLSSKFTSVKIQHGSCHHFVISKRTITAPILNRFARNLIRETDSQVLKNVLPKNKLHKAVNSLVKLQI